jgi:hypothetical protein
VHVCAIEERERAVEQKL